MKLIKSIQSILLTYNPLKENAKEGAELAHQQLNAIGIATRILSLEATHTLSSPCNQALVEQSDAILVFGGDGTILGVARDTARNARPIMGVNMGRFGFLASITMAELPEAINALLNGDYQIIHRFLLEARICPEPSAGTGTEFKHLALNEALITLYNPGRLLELWLGEGDEPALKYRGDGLLIATPTGSTGHSLSAGGPILEPTLAALVITPLSPHSLFNRPLVFDGSKELCVWFRDETQNLRLILDGQIEQPLLASDKILIKRSDFTVPTISIGNRTFTRVLRHKFNLGTESSIE